MEKLTKGIYHHVSFTDVSRLVEIKRSKGLTISLAFPTLNEESTIGAEVDMVRRDLVMQYPLLDEVAVIDSGSTDATREVARDAGADVYLASDILPHLGEGRGKGENLWKSLHVLSGDIIVWIDADIENLHPKFIYGLLGPLLARDDIKFVKAFYERPLAVGGDLLGSGGGRVTEILVRPLFSCFYPELAWIFQPCAGEYAGRRELLEKLPFSMGYGVETGLLIDILGKYGLDVIAQVNLDKRIHRNRSIEALSRMSFEIIHTFMSRLNSSNRIDLGNAIKDQFIRANLESNGLIVRTEEVQTGERPPMIEIPEYKAVWHKKRWSWSGTAKPYTIASA
jgi:glucosyl-3-phosphoglycerate synthase